MNISLMRKSITSLCKLCSSISRQPRRKLLTTNKLDSKRPLHTLIIFKENAVKDLLLGLRTLS